MYSVIIIEDDPVIAQLNSSYIDDTPSLVLTNLFRSGFEALEYLKTNHADLVLLDYHLPGMNGYEFISTLRKFNKKSNIIVITMDNDTSAARLLMNCGIVDYLLKPYTRERFDQAVYAFLQQAGAIFTSEYISQDEIDMMTQSKPSEPKPQPVSRKGIQKETYELLFDHISAHIGRPFTIEELMNEFPLSKVTIRRYLSLFTDEGLIHTEVNYSTGGRPSLIYTYKG